MRGGQQPPICEDVSQFGVYAVLMSSCFDRLYYNPDVNEEEVIEDEYGKIEVLPIWKWLLK